VDQGTQEFHESQAWYVDDDRNRLLVETEAGIQSRRINPVFGNRREATDHILGLLITAIDPG